ncbi:MAG: DUF4255 domain-containing protein [Lachnospiraceae bacterium]|nr:DUF4255 domain-containing protein [Lachnospiraceae bacterium]
MADYSTIANTAQELLRRLTDALVPELISTRDLIGLCAPDDHGDYTVGIWLYDIRENNDIQMHDMISVGQNAQRYPSAYLNMRFMITLFLQSDLKYRAEQEQQILGRIIQMLRDQATMAAGEMLTSGEASGPDMRIRMMNLSMEDKIRLWTVPGTAYRPSLFYEIGPAEILSGRKKDVKRVRDINYRLG